MLKNKFNIGQNVILIAYGKAVQATVVSITNTPKNQLEYRLKRVEKIKKDKPDFGSVWVERYKTGFIGVVDPVRKAEKAKSKFEETFITIYENEIYKDEADFRTNVKINFLPKEKSKK